MAITTALPILGAADLSILHADAASIPRARSQGATSPFGAVEALHASIANRQSPPDCSSARLLLFSLREEQRINGFAALFQFYAAALAMAYTFNRTLVLATALPYAAHLPHMHSALNCSSVHGDSAQCASLTGAVRRLQAASHDANDPWHRAPLPACSGAGMECFLPRASTCSVTALTQGEAIVWRRGAANGSAQRHVFDGVPVIDVASEETALIAGAYTGTSARRLVRVEYLRPLRHALVRLTAGAHAPHWFSTRMQQELCDRERDDVQNARTPRAPTACVAASRAWVPYYFATFELYLFGDVLASAEGEQRQQEQLFRVGVHLRRGDTVSAALAWRPAATLTQTLAAAAEIASRATNAPLYGRHTSAELVFASDSATAREFVQHAPLCSVANDTSPCFPYAAFTHRRVVNAAMPVQSRAGVGVVDIHSTLEPLLAAQTHAAASSPGRIDVVMEAWVVSQAVRAMRAHGATIAHESPAGLVLVLRHQDTLQSVMPYTDAELTAARRTAAVTHGVVADIAALAQAHALIGSCFSQVSRLAAELSLVAGYAREQPVSLDAAACSAFPLHSYTIALQWMPMTAAAVDTY